MDLLWTQHEGIPTSIRRIIYRIYYWEIWVFLLIFVCGFLSLLKPLYEVKQFRYFFHIPPIILAIYETNVMFITDRIPLVLSIK